MYEEDDMKEINNDSNIILARQNYQKGDFKSAIENYNSFLSELPGWNDIELLIHFPHFSSLIADEYFDAYKKFKGLNISETNPIFIQFDEIKKSIKSKIENFKELTDFEEKVKKLGHIHSLWSENPYTGLAKDGWLIQEIRETPNQVLNTVINSGDLILEKFFFLSGIFDSSKLFEKALEVNLIKELIINKWGEYVNEEDDDYEDDENEDRDYSEDEYGSEEDDDV